MSPPADGRGHRRAHRRLHNLHRFTVSQLVLRPSSFLQRTVAVTAFVLPLYTP